MTNHLRLPLLTGSVFALMAGTAIAAPAIGLTGDKTLVMFDTQTLAVSGTMDVGGVDKLHGIDVRPADGMLYGVTGSGKVVTIDLSTGAATEKSTLSEMLPDGVSASVDFNPVADRLRIVGSDGTNLRANVDDGAVTVDGKLGVDSADSYAFDIAAQADLNNTAYLVVGGTLHTVALDTGAATAVGSIEGAALRDIAILP